MLFWSCIVVLQVYIAFDLLLCANLICSTPFELHDDSYVLKAMRFCDKEQNDGINERSSNGGESSSSQPIFPPQMPQPTRPSSSGKVPSSPPIPGILKARALKHEHWHATFDRCVILTCMSFSFDFLCIMQVIVAASLAGSRWGSSALLAFYIVVESIKALEDAHPFPIGASRGTNPLYVGFWNPCYCNVIA